MRWSDTIELVPQVPGTSDIGDPILTDGEPREVYANKQSVRQSEFYQAAQAGLRPELMFIVRSEEYENEGKLRYCGKDYTIIRTFDKGETTELVCGGLVSD